MQHTVEKIGGTSMSRFGDLIGPLFLGNRTPSAIGNRIFVVSAYDGITNMLLEHKKSGAAGVYQFFKNNDAAWQERLDAVLAEMQRINAGFAAIGLAVAEANAHIHERIEGIKSCLMDLQRLCSYGHFHMTDYLPAVRELLSSVGEYHSAWNSERILRHHGANAVLADLTGWKNTDSLGIDEKIRTVFAGIDIKASLVVATGYTKCSEGLMKTFDRGYSEITFSKIATITGAREGIIHKEFHLSSADPKLVGTDKVKIIGEMNFDMADQLADLGMEAIHPQASKGMELLNIPIRVKNAFAPGEPGTLITGSYATSEPKISMICGRSDLIAIEINDPEMVGQFGYDHKIVSCLTRHRISYIAKNTNANTITHYIAEKSGDLMALSAELGREFPRANLRRLPVALVSVVGSNLSKGGMLARAARSLAEKNIEVLAVNQCMRQINLQFVVTRENYRPAVVQLHEQLIPS